MVAIQPISARPPNPRRPLSLRCERIGEPRRCLVLDGCTTGLPENAMSRVRIVCTLIGEGLLSGFLMLLSVLGDQELTKHFGDLGFVIGFGIFALSIFVFLDCARRFLLAVRA